MKAAQRRCLFCGVLAGDVPLVNRVKRLVCRDCFYQMGKIFSGRERRLESARVVACLSCGRRAHGRMLVAGVAAAVCRACYRRAAQGPIAIALDAKQTVRGRRKQLDRSRAVRLQGRRRFQDIKRVAHSVERAPLEPAVRMKRLVKLTLKAMSARSAERPRLFRIEEGSDGRRR